jgi:hypothetical protein
VQGSKAEELLGQDVPMKFLDLDESRERIVLSARKARSTTAATSGLKVRVRVLQHFMRNHCARCVLDPKGHHNTKEGKDVGLHGNSLARTPTHTRIHTFLVSQMNSRCAVAAVEVAFEPVASECGMHRTACPTCESLVVVAQYISSYPCTGLMCHLFACPLGPGGLRWGRRCD